MKSLLGKASPTKKVKFLNDKDTVEIKKLSGLEIKDFSKFVAGDVKKLPEEEQGIAIQNYIIRMGVVDAEALTDEEIDSFPLADISKLAKEVLAYSGVNTGDEGNA